MYKVNNLPKYLVLGQQGEKNVTSFEFDITAWKTTYPNGIVSLSAIRPDETVDDAYVPNNIAITLDSGVYTLTWTVDDVDTANDGRGSFSLNITDEGITYILKSNAVTTIVMENLAMTGTPPAAIADWLTSSLLMLSNLTSAYEGMEFLHIKYSVIEPTTNEEMVDTIEDWIGIYFGDSQTAPTAYTDYQWLSIKGDTGTSAYDSAVLGGYVGSEADFYEDFAILNDIRDSLIADLEAI